ncbi:MAG: DUF1579 domain-containing protein [Pelomonas sp.]|nr:DUF1579 domain-containing protein [Roseateles sp.]
MQQPQDTTASSPADFDFLMGRWRVRHRRLCERLAGCTDWDEFEGTSEAAPLLGGHGNVDDNWLDLPAGAYRAVSLRSFDAATRQWSIWWLDGRTPMQIDTPMRGGFSDGVGLFLADDTFQGRAIRVRFLWSRITPRSARWEQAFSADGGLSWETNWEMDFERVTAA